MREAGKLFGLQYPRPDDTIGFALDPDEEHTASLSTKGNQKKLLGVTYSKIRFEVSSTPGPPALQS